MYRKVILRMAIMLSCLASAHLSFSQFEDWKFEIIPTPVEDIQISASAVDEHGMIWMATRLGIMTFDGINYKRHPIFQEVSIQSRTLNARYLKFDPMGRLWVLTDDRGVLVYDFKTREHYFLNNSTKADIFLSDHRCGDVVFEDDKAWLTTFDHQIHEINLDLLSIDTHDTWTNIISAFPNAKHGIVGGMVRKDNFLWIGSEYGITKYNTHSSESELIAYNFRVEFETNSLLNYAMYLNGEDLVISLPFKDHSGICVLDLGSSKWKFCSDLGNKDFHFLSLHIRSFFRWSDSILVAGARRFAFHAINPKTYESSAFFEEELNLEFRDLQEIYKVVKINEDLGYIVCRDHIVRFRKFDNPFKFVPINPSGESNSNWQRSFYNTSNGAYIGTDFGDGLLKINWKEKAVEHFPNAAKFALSKEFLDIESIVKRSDGRLWLGSSEGLLLFDPASETIVKDQEVGLYTPDIPVSSILELFLLGPHLFIATTNDGLYAFHTPTKVLGKVNFKSNKTQDKSVLVKDILEISDSTFLVTTAKGLRKLTLRKGIMTGDISSDISGSTISEIDLNYMTRIGDTIYMGSNGDGLFRFLLSEGSIIDIENYSNPENIRYNITVRIIPDRDGRHLWVNTGDGIAKFDRRSHNFINYSVHEGLGFRGRGYKNFHMMNDGAIIVGAHLGLEYFYPDSIDSDEVPIQPYISTVYTDSTFFSSSSFEMDTLNISSTEDNLAILMAALNFNPDPLTYYTYQLEGYDKEWSKPSTSSTAQFTKLPGGDFNFKYKVATKNHNWVDGNPLFVSKEKKIKEMSLFYLFMAVLGGGFLYAIFRWRMNQIREKAEIEQEYHEQIKELEINALRLQMNPHFIFNSINSINWFVIKNDKKNASNYLTKFSRLIRIILENSKSPLITIADEIEAVRLYLEMEKLRFDTQFDHGIKIENHMNLSTLLMPPLIFQPYIENAIWHGLMPKTSPGLLNISLHLEANNIICTIEDDGIGREASKKKHKNKILKKESLGLKITDDRLAIMESKYDFKAKTEIQDMYDEEGHASGTRVIVTLPIIRKNQILLP